MRLSDEQLQQFRQDGFIHIKQFAGAEQCEAILDVAKAHLKHKIEPIETEIGYHEGSKAFRTDEKDYTSQSRESFVTVRRLRQVYSRDILFKTWMEDANIRPILQQILNDTVVLTTAHHNSIMTKMPHQGTATSWHQDRRYWRYSDDNLVSVWLALDAEHSQNGVLEFIPGSHTMKFSPEQFDDKEYFREDTEQNKTLITQKVSMDLKKGDIVIFHALLLHRANQNSTDKAKISFVYTVKGASTKALEGSRSAVYPEIILERL
ncbi:MAG TPA: phytanoyl-CoA dioxygenase family protein [Sulfurovum sp.]|jgi:phytanoyl-CoA hydroxylase|nr:MAG: phytanoyl-CoA dioxygenase [Sulfurovum sp. 35-42-20]OYZ26271.1 MAG: phytanoyl-CoA dioxygenase [Sulfurovum sp. 16-42-52]OYZ47779.1 MAG: phytanoyl-CoA dioxygenase [Sulfurovum sp. 24-42-9]OZA46551.1 MAG: phytanoyl-CoA dioxygenase [Sulfurovum sp. 17-42-90]OZA60819.1 MAG: phytanoyl-CoA dioxygenase [Sulfurovum sp. 39-42-12]HQR74488.1 phytanoyl-CoA dioxygenase family protein [Sulfurovum sp.]